MAGYLDQYGAGDERRERTTKRSIAIVIAALILGLLIFYLGKDFSQISRGKHFVSLVRAKDYPSAYQMWGCSVDKPCSVYDFAKFQEDWAANSQVDPAVFGITDAEACKAGVILTIQLTQTNETHLWVEDAGGPLSFAPVATCPNRGPYSIMLHRTIGKLRKPFLN